MTPSLETCAGLYAAALEQKDAAERGLARILASAAQHGYTEEQLANAASRAIIHQKDHE